MSDPTPATDDIPPVTEAQVSRIMDMLILTSKIEDMSDAALSDAVLNEVWGKLSFCSREDWLLNEMITRFDERCGIVRDEDGEVVSINPLDAALSVTLAQGHPVIVDVNSPTTDLRRAVMTPIAP